LLSIEDDVELWDRVRASWFIAQGVRFQSKLIGNRLPETFGGLAGISAIVDVSVGGPKRRPEAIDISSRAISLYGANRRSGRKIGRRHASSRVLHASVMKERRQPGAGTRPYIFKPFTFATLKGLWKALSR
jgi:hypothetical protein